MQHLRAHRVALEVLVLNVTNNIDILTEDTSLHVRSPHCVHIAHKSTHLEKNGPLNTLSVRVADIVTVHVMTQTLKERILINLSVRHAVGVIGVGLPPPHTHYHHNIPPQHQNPVGTGCR